MAEEYYINSTGSGRNPGTREAPWQSLEDLQKHISRLKPGDRVYFRRGDQFFGSLNISSSGSEEAPLYFGAYGEGPDPILKGIAGISEWEALEGDHYVSSVPSDYLPAPGLIIDGSFQPLARFPDSSAANSGYMTIDSSRGKQELQSRELSRVGNVKGAEAVIRSELWVLDRAEIRRHRGDTLSLNNSSYYDIREGFGFFLQNHPDFLTLHGEWYYNKADRRIGILWDSSQAGPLNQALIEVPVINTIITIENQHYIEMEDLHLYGSGKQSIRIIQSDNIQLKNCTIELSAETALWGENLQNLEIRDCRIDQSQDTGLVLRNIRDSEITGNTIDHTGDRAGMGQSTDDRYMAVYMEGENLLFSKNTLLNTGYVPLRFNGNHIRIENNRIDHYAFVKNDAGGIYCWSFGGEYIDRVISGNIISGGIGITDGTNLKNMRMVEGIYIDDRSNHVEISHNQIVGIPGNGIKLHNAHSVNIHHNLLADNNWQIGFYRDKIIDDYDAYPIIDNQVENNLFLNTRQDQLFIRMYSIYNDFAEMARFGNNRYQSLFPQESPFETRRNMEGSHQRKRYSWEQWLERDSTSQWKNYELTPPRLARPIGNNRFRNGTFSSGITPWSTWSPKGNTRLEHLSSERDGVLKMAFRPAEGNRDSYGQLTGVVATVEEGASYLLSFDCKSENGGIACEAILRKNGDPYINYSTAGNFISQTEWTHQRMIFTSVADERDARIDFSIPEGNGDILFDNIEFMEVEMDAFRPGNYYRLEINDTLQPMDVELPGVYENMRGEQLEGLQKLEPWSVGIWIRK